METQACGNAIHNSKTTTAEINKNGENARTEYPAAGKAVAKEDKICDKV